MTRISDEQKREYEFLKKLREQPLLAVYGAGDYAKRLLAYLKMKQICVCAVVVLDRSKNVLNIEGYPVFQFNDVPFSPNTFFLVAVSDKYSAEGVAMLEERHYIHHEVITRELYGELLAWIKTECIQAPIVSKQLLVNCFDGAGYAGNCKYTVEKLRSKDSEIRIVWIVNQMDDPTIPEGIIPVLRSSAEYYRQAYISHVFLSNNGFDAGRILKRDGQYYIQTWHGTGPFKKVNASIANDETEVETVRREYSLGDIFISNSADNTQMFREAFCYDGVIEEWGSPRNDVFFRRNNLYAEIREKCGIPKDRGIVLYAPTFRKDIETSLSKYDLDMDAVLKALQRRFSKPFVLLYRFHHQLYQSDKIRNRFPNGIDMTFYPDVQELLVASDVLITDYSSIMWDFSLQKRPVFLYHNDEQEYSDDRGFYCPVARWPYIKGHDSEEMCARIESFDNETYQKALSAFFLAYPSYDDGHAAERLANRILDVMGHPEKY